MDDSFHFCFFLLFLIPFLNSPLLSAQKWDGGLMMAQSDYQALRALQHGLTDSRGLLRSWNNHTATNPCSHWAGIKCVRGRVIAILLPWRGLSGHLSENIGHLKALRRLSLHDNFLSGPLPKSLGALPHLRAVYLFNNCLSGPIPPSIGDCSLLRTLHLGNNQLTGVIPPGLANSNRLCRLDLSSNGLSGSIPASLFGSESLTSINLSNNAINGSLLEMFSNLSSLVTVKLENNNLDGLIPESISLLQNLSVLNLSRNKFGGRIPAIIGDMAGITILDLSNNNFSGEIPVSLARLSNLSSFNVSYNNLSGPVPSFLAKKFNYASFIGNIQLCGYIGSSNPCPSPTPSPDNISPSSSQTGHSRRLRGRDIILIAAGSLLVILLIMCLVPLCFFIRKRVASKAMKGGKTEASASSEPAMAMGPDNGGKLVHFDSSFIFTADDLLCATAETMGKSAYGTTYKATLEDGDNTVVAVKRLREKITKPQIEFESEVSLLGKIRHPNILPLRAYYVGPKGEKLLVHDYMPNGSLASFLHARGPESSIPWPVRKAIAVGIARGLWFLHTEHDIVHGNLTTSNILLDLQNSPKIAEAGLSRLVTASGVGAYPTATAGAMGYQAPELSKPKKASAMSDVFSLGVILLELLTGKSPDETGHGPDLPRWVASGMKEENTGRLFDAELWRDADGHELLGALRLALNCVDPSPAARPDTRQVLQDLEELRPEEDVVGPVSGDEAVV